MEHLEHLLLLAGCLAVTLFPALSGACVRRRPLRLGGALPPAAAAFITGHVVAVACGVRHGRARHVTEIMPPPAVPLEELLFLLVVPVRAMLTLGAVRRPSRGAVPGLGHAPPAAAMPPAVARDRTAGDA